MKKALKLTFAALVLSATPAFALMAKAERVAALPLVAGATGCMTETATISINFNGTEADVTTIKSKFDAKIADIQNVIKDAGFTKAEMQSMNYSISPQNYGGMNSSFQFNGSIGFTVLPSDKATQVMADLIKKGYMASVNVNSYRNGVPCPVQPPTDK